MAAHVVNRFFILFIIIIVVVVITKTWSFNQYHTIFFTKAINLEIINCSAVLNHFAVQTTGATV